MNGATYGGYWEYLGRGFWEGLRESWVCGTVRPYLSGELPSGAKSSPSGRCSPSGPGPGTGSLLLLLPPPPSMPHEVTKSQTRLNTVYTNQEG